MLVIDMICEVSKMAIKFMKCVKHQIHFSTKRLEKDNFYYCADL